MKKFLALVLALVMTMSLVTISAGAEDYTDAADMNYADAVDVMSTVGVVSGYADGSFNPQAGLTRGAAAKIICNMILGPTTAEALNADAAPYSDVAVDNVFAGYIAYCAKEGIISGYADGTFRPAAPLTGYAFMKMLLGALGYDAEIEGYTGANWSINVAKRALNIGLDAGLVNDFVGAKALTREEACLYAFNTLKADMVKYNQKSTISVGDLVITQNSDAVVLNDNDSDNIWKTDGKEYSTQFAEKYFKKLSVKTDDVDAFGRPAHTWFYDKEPIGTYALTPDFVYVNEFSEDVIEDLTDDKYVMPAAANVVYNGAADSNGIAWYYGNDGKAVNGFTVELFDTNDDKTFDKMVVIEEYFAQVGKFTPANEKTDKAAKVKLTVFENKTPAGYEMTIEDDEKKDTDAYDMLAAYEKDDYVAIVLKGDGSEVLAVSDVEAVEGKLQKVTEKLHVGTSTVKMDGTTYTLNNECVNVVKYGTAAAAGHVGTLYLDAQGCVIGWVSDSTATSAANLVYVAKIYPVTDKYNVATYYAQVVHTDGTVEDIELEDVQQLENTVCSYDYAAAGDSAYTLTKVTDTDKVEALSTAIKDTDARVEGDYVTDDVVFIFVKDAGSDLVVTVKEGVQDVDTIPANSFSVKNTDKDVVAVFVRAAASAAVDAEDLVYIADTTAVGSALDADGKKQPTYNFYINGEKMTEIVKTTGSVGFKTYAVDGETYEFTAVGTDDGAYVEKVITVAKDKYVSSTEVTGMTDATVTGGIYDLTGNEVETLAELADLGATTIKASVIYDKDENVITSMYITSVVIPTV